MRGTSVKTLKKLLKKAGLKTTGRKAALTRRAKKAHLKIGGAYDPEGDKEHGLMPNVVADWDASPNSGLSNKTPVQEEEEDRVDRSFAPPDYYDGESGKGVRKSEAKGKLPSRSGGRHRRGHRSRKH